MYIIGGAGGVGLGGIDEEEDVLAPGVGGVDSLDGIVQLVARAGNLILDALVEVVGVIDVHVLGHIAEHHIAVLHILRRELVHADLAQLGAAVEETLGVGGLGGCEVLDVHVRQGRAVHEQALNALQLGAGGRQADALELLAAGEHIGHLGGVRSRERAEVDGRQRHTLGKHPREVRDLGGVEVLQALDGRQHHEVVEPPTGCADVSLGERGVEGHFRHQMVEGEVPPGVVLLAGHRLGLPRSGGDLIARPDLLNLAAIDLGAFIIDGVGIEEGQRLAVLGPEDLRNGFVVVGSQMTLCLACLPVHLIHVRGHGTVGINGNFVDPRAAADIADGVLGGAEVVGVHAIDARLEAGDGLQRGLEVELVPGDLHFPGGTGGVDIAVVGYTCLVAVESLRSIAPAFIGTCQSEEQEVRGPGRPARLARDVVLADGVAEGTVRIRQTPAIILGIVAKAVAENQRQLIERHLDSDITRVDRDVLTTVQTVPCEYALVDEGIEQLIVARRLRVVEAPDEFAKQLACIVSENLTHIVGDDVRCREVVDQVLQVVGLVGVVIEVQRSDGGGTAVLVHHSGTAHGLSSDGQRIHRVVGAVVVVPVVPSAIHLVAHFHEGLGVLVLHEFRVDHGSIALEDEGFRAKRNLGIIPGVGTDGAVGDEGPLAQVGQVEIGIDEAVGLAFVLIAVVEDDAGVSESPLVALIFNGRFLPRTRADERTHVRQQLARQVLRRGLQPRVVHGALAGDSDIVGSARQPQIYQVNQAVARLAIDGCLVGVNKLEVIELVAEVVGLAG